MVTKQDLVAPRTASDVERKFGKSFAEVFGLAEDAQKVAMDAQEAADKATEAVENLDQTEIFNLLTNNGALKGLFMKDGELYINASYLATGVIKSENGKLVIDLSGTTEPTFNTGISTNGIVVRSDEAGSGGYVRIYPLKMTATDGTVYYVPNFYMLRMDDSTLCRIWADVNNVSYLSMPSPNLKKQVSIIVGNDIASGYRLINSAGNNGYFVIDTDAKTHLTVDKINDKTVSWKANGDGTFTLIGQ